VPRSWCGIEVKVVVRGGQTSIELLQSRTSIAVSCRQLRGLEGSDCRKSLASMSLRILFGVVGTFLLSFEVWNDIRISCQAVCNQGSATLSRHRSRRREPYRPPVHFFWTLTKGRFNFTLQRAVMRIFLGFFSAISFEPFLCLMAIDLPLEWILAHPK